MQLPRDKQDIAAALALQAVPVDELGPHIPVLLEWLRDMNWPVARPVAAALARCGIQLVAPLRAALSSTDDIWKYWIVSHLLLEVDGHVRHSVADLIVRIRNAPTAGEITEEVHLAAGDVLILLGLNDS